MTAWWPAILAYFLGSIPSGVLVAKLWGLSDPRTKGSGNIGAANMARLGGKKVGAITFLLDFLKGFFPVLIARLVAPDDNSLACITALLTVFGHCYSIFLRFEGGKGVATTAGALLLVAPITMGFALAAWAFVFFSFRISSLAAMVALLILIYSLFLTKADPFLMVAAAISCLIVIRRHLSNLEDLLNNSERKF